MLAGAALAASLSAHPKPGPPTGFLLPGPCRPSSASLPEISCPTDDQIIRLEIAPQGLIHLLQRERLELRIHTRSHVEAAPQIEIRRQGSRQTRILGARQSPEIQQ